MSGDRSECRARLGDGELAQILLAPPGTGTSVPTTYTGGSPPVVPPGFLGSGAQRCGALGHDLVREHDAGRPRRTSSNRGGSCDSLRRTYSPTMTLGAAERLPRRQGLPGVGTQVIAAEEDALARQAALIRKLQHQVAKLRRPQSRVAALLIHLVGGGLDQRMAARGARVLERGAQRQRMRRADGVNPDRPRRRDAAAPGPEAPSRGLLRLDGKEGRRDEGQHDAGDLQRLGDQTQQRQREKRGDERRAGVGERRDDDCLAVAEGIHQRERTHRVQDLGDGGEVGTLADRS